MDDSQRVSHQAHDTYVCVYSVCDSLCQSIVKEAETTVLDHLFCLTYIILIRKHYMKGLFGVFLTTSNNKKTKKILVSKDEIIISCLSCWLLNLSCYIILKKKTLEVNNSLSLYLCIFVESCHTSDEDHVIISHSSNCLHGCVFMICTSLLACSLADAVKTSCS